MDTKIILIYCVCTDFLKNTRSFHPNHLHMSDDEVLTFAIVAAMFFVVTMKKLASSYIPHSAPKQEN